MKKNKKHKKHIIFLLIFLILLATQGCDKPAPTQLLPEDPLFDEQVEIEVLSSDPSFDSRLGGVDTTGLSEDILQYSNLISVTGAKFTHNNSTQYSSIGQAIFFDKSQPIILNDVTIGYGTISLGTVKFDNINAAKIPLRKRFKRDGVVGDTLLGFYFAALGRGHMGGNNFNFPYGSNIDFNYEILGTNIASFQIPTPPEIHTQFQILGRRINNNLAIRLNWDPFQNAKFEIIISGKKKGGNENIPLYRLRTRDDGLIIIPPKLINSIPPDRFSGFVLTLVRKFTGNHTAQNSELFVSSQSIHSIQIDFN